MFAKYTFYINLVFIVSSVYSQVGTECNLPITSKKGVCKPVRDCPSAQRAVQVGAKPVICGRQNNLPIVCCEGKATVTQPVTNFNVPYIRTSPTPSSSFMRISERKCKEYSRPVVQIVQAQPLGFDSAVDIKETANCGYDGIPLIYGGQKVILGEFPHMALLGYSDPIQWLCGGSLISDEYVLTAAHCITTSQFGSVRIVRLGELNVKEVEPGSNPVDINIIDRIKHPEYKRPKIYNDIALIRLARKVPFSTYIRPACLWNRYDLNTDTTVATGWGTTEDEKFMPSDDLLKVGLNIIPSNECNTIFLRYVDRKIQGIQRSQICARNTSHLGDTCTGDSGGPIQITAPDNKCIYYVIGVTSAGRACGGNIPGVYTRVSEYISWIENIVWG